ncbi:type II toxin-antitoxin system HicB family antitoxin [Herminiimonas sp. CN]|uniref:type II toxin-antitoxin system HicB family antitoxin n=1 Tax=Herminiimonas sp. CN TaxID=1349818 RepID=UPI000473CA19|nr:type II toxin-antitoxin system HicB family antitoxin [Herminiimonas sp. CN]
MNIMTHKGYLAKVEYSDEDEIFAGRLAGIDDIVGFHGESVAELKAAFIEAVEDYLDTCKKLGKKPQKTYSGKFVVRVEPEIHARAVIAAQSEGKSLNAWIGDAITAKQLAHC